MSGKDGGQQTGQAMPALRSFLSFCPAYLSLLTYFPPVVSPRSFAPPSPSPTFSVVLQIRLLLFSLFFCQLPHLLGLLCAQFAQHLQRLGVLHTHI